jgi:phosphoglycolate phosphatase
MIVFDLDGTLIDSSRDLTEAASELVQGYGASPLAEAEVVGMVGEGAKLLVQRALAYAGLDADTPGALDRFMAIYDRRLLDHTVPYEGMHEVLAMLLQALTGVTHEKPAGPAGRSSSTSACEVFGSAGRTARSTGRSIRAPRCFGLGLLMVGDSPIDASTAEGGVPHSCWRPMALRCKIRRARARWGAGRASSAPVGVAGRHSPSTRHACLS